MDGLTPRPWDRRRSAGWTVPVHPSPTAHEHDLQLWKFPVGHVSRGEQACSTRGVGLPADARGQSTLLSFLDTSAGPRDAARGMISLENEHPAHSKPPWTPTRTRQKEGTNDEDKHGAALAPGHTEA